MVVVGRGSDANRELLVENVVADSVPVRRRETGGCAVVLAPQMVVVAFSIRHATRQPPLPFFRRFNHVLQQALIRARITGVETAGMSDLAIRGRKIGGASLYRGRDLVFFHAVINVAGDTDLIERYLRFPPRQPAYRNGRPHRDFVTSLAAERLELDPRAFAQSIELEFGMMLRELGAEARLEWPDPGRCLSSLGKGQLPGRQAG